MTPAISRERARSALPWRAQRTDSGLVPRSGGFWFAAARHGVLISEAEPLDLPLDLLPALDGLSKSNGIAALKVSTQLIVPQKPSIDVFHGRAHTATAVTAIAV